MCNRILLRFIAWYYFVGFSSKSGVLTAFLVFLSFCFIDCFALLCFDLGGISGGENVVGSAWVEHTSTGYFLGLRVSV